ncbi:hypothetical protein FN846DRAFT_991049 [Sphaerosporella brunnea]|uniref:Uncharacterized protein n=1 Tax=Sphaerosporella brunnea TaxID=1250544 RepID=A0A5J5EN91_9PEZI|nr:hypothetical protein FN846DRAFT_991049 [Sphaerosporella brunnea]
MDPSPPQTPRTFPAPPRSPFPPKSPSEIYVPTKDGWTTAHTASPVRGVPPQMPRSAAEIHRSPPTPDNRRSHRFPDMRHAQGMGDPHAQRSESPITPVRHNRSRTEGAILMTPTPTTNPTPTPTPTPTRERANQNQSQIRRSLSIWGKMKEPETQSDAAPPRPPTKKSSCVIQ